MHTGLAVIESRWWPNGNDSVRPLFEVLAGIVEANPHAVRYDMFTDAGSLTGIVSDIAEQTDPNFHSLYLAAHGDENSICGLGGESVSRAKLRNIIINANGRAAITGLYFGSCLVGTRKNAEFLMQGSGLQWIGGYTESVDWVDSSAVDLVFWSKYISEIKTNRSRRKGKRSNIEMVKLASAEMKKIMPNISNQLGFNIYYLDGGGNVDSVW